MAVLTNTMMQGTAAFEEDDAYQIEKSLRFVTANDPSLSRTIGTSGNRRVWTFSCWAKRCATGTNHRIMSSGADSDNYFFLEFGDDDYIKIKSKSGGNNVFRAYTSGVGAKHRDLSAWYSIVLAVDTTQALAGDRVLLYVNGKDVALTLDTTPAQNLETEWLDTANTHKIGQNGWDTANDYDGYLADVQFIDGLALSPAAFGSFDSSGCWNPKTFALPAPNTNKTWSNMVTAGTGSFRTHNSGVLFGPLRLFDGNITTACQDDSNSSGNSITFTPTNGIAFTQLVEVYCYGSINHVYNWEYNDGTKGSKVINGEKWHKVIEGSGTLKWLKVEANAANYIEATAIRIDGVVLRDGQTDPTTRNNPNNGTEWKNASFNSGGDSNNYYKIFDGDNSDWMNLTNGNSPYTFTPPTGIPITSLRLYLENDTTYTVALNGGSAVSYPTPALGYYDIDLADHSNITTLTSIALSSAAGGSGMAVRAIEINGQQLVDSTVDNSFHLKFNDAANIGINNFSEDLSDSSGKADNARPILKTNSLGTSPTSGYRTDDDSSNLWVAIPFNGTAGGNTVVDESNHINNSSTEKTVTLSSFITSATKSKYYGTSGSAPSHYSRVRIDGSSETAVGTGNYTIEFWLYHTNSGSNNPIYDSRSSGSANGHVLRQTAATTFEWRGPSSALVSFTSGAQNTWNHYAIVRSGTSTNQTKIYVNGTQAAECTDATDASNTGYVYLCKNADGPDATNHGIAGYFQDFRLYKTNKYTSGFDVEAKKDFIDNNLNTDPIVKVTDATGAKPVLVTTGDYGGGTTDAANTDSDASTLLICLSGKSLTEVEPSGRTAATRTWTAYGDAGVSTDTSRFYGSSFKFDGTGDYISASDSTDFDMGTTNFTIEAWVYVNNLTHHGIVCGQVQDGSATNCAYSLQVDNGLPTFKCFYSTSVFSCISPNKIAAGEWFHMAGVYDGANQFLYVNGKLVKTLANPYGMNNGGPDFHLGAALSGSPGNWSRNTLLNGYVQDVRVYKNKLKYTNNFSITSEGKSILNDTLNDTPTNYGTDTGAGGEVRGTYCTWNPQACQASAHAGFRQGNLEVIASTDGNSKGGIGTIALPSTGKYYWEYEEIHRSAGANSGGGFVGVGENGVIHSTAASGTRPGETNSPSWGISINSFDARHAGNSDHADYLNGGTVPATTGVIGVAVDMDNDKMWMSYNNTWGNASGTGNPATGANPAFSGEFSGKTIFPCHSIAVDSGTGYIRTNFGQRAFKYTAPSGFKTLCTQNFDDTFSGDELNNPSKYFDILTYEGTGTTAQEVLGLGFQPDLVWIKNRDGTHAHHLYDAIRGKTSRIFPNTQDEANTSAPNIFDFKSTGIEVDEDVSDGTNNDGDSFVAWNWDAGTAAATASTDGSITPDAQWVNATAGLSITKYTGTQANATVGHGLNAAPDFMIHKMYDDGSTDWQAWHSTLNGTQGMQLTNGVPFTQADMWNNTAPTNTVFHLGAGTGTNKSGKSIMMYLWTAIPGYSAFGSYSGGVSPTFIYTGMKPKFVIIKCTSHTDSWVLYDSERNQYNIIDDFLQANNNEAEATGNSNQIDILSNGFNIIGAQDGTAGAGRTYIYCAWAEHPLKTARAH